MQEIGHLVAKFSGFAGTLSVVSSGLRALRQKFARLFPWSFGRCTATFVGHECAVCCLAVLDGGRLASGSLDRTIKVCCP